MRNMIKEFLQISCAIFFVVCVFSPVNAFADVSIYAEGAYTESDLAVYLYADISSSTELRGAAVKLTYDISQLTVESAEKNISIWNLANESYFTPDFGTDGEVVIILGKLDKTAPTQGVTGNRILLGKVRFNRTEANMSFSSTLGLELGQESPFTNFVDVNKTVLDSTVVFGAVTLAERIVESPNCISAKLKAAKTLCKALINCSAKSIKNPSKTDQKACFENAPTKFEASWKKAEAKAAKNSSACQTSSMSDVEDSIALAIEALYEKISDGIDSENKNARKLGQALLKTARKRCVDLLGAEIANFKKSNPEKLKKNLTKADDNFKKGWSKTRNKADKKKVAYTGPSDSDVADIIDGLVIEILSGMGL